MIWVEVDSDRVYRNPGFRSRFPLQRRSIRKFCAARPQGLIRTESMLLALLTQCCVKLRYPIVDETRKTGLPWL